MSYKKYSCEKCNKEFAQKSNYETHLNRKYPCSIEQEMQNKQNAPQTIQIQNIMPIFLNNLVRTLQNLQNTPQLQQNITNILQNALVSIQNLPKIQQGNNQINKPKEHKCSYCAKTYSRSDVLKRHMEKYCKEMERIV
jgi:uncharacterized Zn-finger protein